MHFFDQTSMNNININSKKPDSFIVHFAGAKDKNNESKMVREELFTNYDWISAVTNKKLRKEILEYYNKPRSEQLSTSQMTICNLKFYRTFNLFFIIFII